MTKTGERNAKLYDKQDVCASRRCVRNVHCIHRGLKTPRDAILLIRRRVNKNEHSNKKKTHPTNAESNNNIYTTEIFTQWHFFKKHEKKPIRIFIRHCQRQLYTKRPRNFSKAVSYFNVDIRIIKMSPTYVLIRDGLDVLLLTLLNWKIFSSRPNIIIYVLVALLLRPPRVPLSEQYRREFASIHRHVDIQIILSSFPAAWRPVTVLSKSFNNFRANPPDSRVTSGYAFLYYKPASITSTPDTFYFMTFFHSVKGSSVLLRMDEVFYFFFNVVVGYGLMHLCQGCLWFEYGKIFIRYIFPNRAATRTRKCLRFANYYGIGEVIFINVSRLATQRYCLNRIA